MKKFNTDANVVLYNLQISNRFYVIVMFLWRFPVGLIPPEHRAQIRKSDNNAAIFVQKAGDFLDLVLPVVSSFLCPFSFL